MTTDKFKPGDIVWIWNYDLQKPDVAIVLNYDTDIYGEDFFTITCKGNISNRIYKTRLFHNIENCKPTPYSTNPSGEILMVEPMPLPKKLLYFLDQQFNSNKKD